MSTCSIVELHADHTGSGSFGVNLLVERGICFDGSCATRTTVPFPPQLIRVVRLRSAAEPTDATVVSSN
jgi:hypothetical protein